MPRANTDFNSLPFWTKLGLGLAFGFDPNMWSPLAHRWTKWEYWAQPDGEKITVWKHRTKVSERPTSSTVPFQESSYFTKDGEKFVVNTDKANTLTYDPRIWEGTYTGEPLQEGRKDTDGKAVCRAVTYGYAEYGDHFAVPAPGVPVPNGPYLHCGDPNIASDRHVNIVNPVDGSIHELIQFDDAVADTNLSNQALYWGQWKDGKLLRGQASTATGVSITSVMWDRTSRERGGHMLGLVLFDYVGADGTLVNGPIAGEIYYLPKDAPSYIAMMKLGGECAAVAQALNEYGCILFDRSGYADPGSTNKIPGKVPKVPSVPVQWGAWGRGTNLNLLKINITELRMIVRK